MSMMKDRNPLKGVRKNLHKQRVNLTKIFKIS